MPKDKNSYNIYMRDYHLKRYYRMRGEAIKYLGGKCSKCSSLKKLQLDHIDPSTKEIEVSMLLNVSKVRFWLEVKKCQLLCQPCHALKTILEQGKKPAKGTHGTLSAYRYCKCELCKSVKREYTREWRKKRLAS